MSEKEPDNGSLNRLICVFQTMALVHGGTQHSGPGQRETHILYTHSRAMRNRWKLSQLKKDNQAGDTLGKGK